MAGAVGSFLTGFLEKTTETIDKRGAEADDYFQKQMEIARTRGLENKTRNDQAMAGTMNQAKQLQAAGVPKDLVIAIAKQNPDDIPEYLSNIQKWKMSGINVNEDFFRSIVRVQGEVGSDEDLPTVIRRIYEPLAAQAASNPEEFNNDPETGIWAALMGRGAMDRARDRLGRTEVADGLTAEQLIAYGDQPRLNVDPNVVVSLDATTLGNEMRATEARLNPPRPRDNSNSPNETATMLREFDESIEKERVAFIRSTDISPESPEGRTAWEAEAPNAMRRVAEKMAMDYSYAHIGQIPTIANWLNLDEEQESSVSGQEPQAMRESVSEAPYSPERVEPVVATTGEEKAPTAASQSVSEPKRPGLTTVDKEDPKLKIGKLIKDNGDGTSFWKTKSGKLVKVRNSQLSGLGLSEAPS